MDIFIHTLLGLSLSGTILILFLFLCKPFYKNRLSQTWQYYIYLIVVIRLLFPFTIRFITIDHFFPQKEISIQLEKKVKTFLFSSNQKNDLKSHSFLFKENSEQKKSQVQRTDPISNSNIGNYKRHRSFYNILLSLKNKIIHYFRQYFFFVWLMIAMILFIRKVTQYQNFINYVKAGKKEITSFELLEQLGKEVERLNIKSTITCYENNLISSPLLIGFFHPCIILPSTNLSNKDLQHIFCHELIHFRRKDLFYKWLIQIVICFHWFNPFVYLMSFETNRLCELSCDEIRMKKLDKKERKEYGDTLLHMVGIDSTLKSSLASVTLNEGKNLLKERMDFIMKFKQKTKLHSIISLILGFTLCITSISLGNALLKEDVFAVTKKEEAEKEEQSNKNEKTALFEDSDLTLIDQWIADHKVILEDNIYYILCNGATKKDCPSGTTDGINITIVTKSAYASISPDSLDTIVIDTTESCESWFASKDITRKQAKLAIGLAVRLKENNGRIEDLDTKQEEYKKWGITRDEQGNFYYNKERVYILVELKRNHVLQNLYYDKKGTVSVKIRKTKNGTIKKVNTLTAKQIKDYSNLL